MSDLIVACVRTGDRIPFDCITTLRNSVARHLQRKHTMVCLTDQPERCTGVAFADIGAMNLAGRWARMALFEPQWRVRAKVIFLASDVAVIGDISPLADVPGEFAILSEAGKYNSSVMVIGGMGNFVWNAFERRRDLLMRDHRFSGPSSCIRELYPSAAILQKILPPDFFGTRLRLMQVQ